MPAPTPVPPTPTPTPVPIPFSDYDTQNIRWLKNRHQALYSQIEELTWVQDGLSDRERETIEWLSLISRYSKQAAAAVIAMPWLQDGITVTEATVVEYTYWTARKDTVLAEHMLAKSWMQDDITEHEATAIEHTYWVVREDTALAEHMLAKSWMQDGISRDEATVIDRLASTIRAEDESLQPQVIQKVIEILAMPFLDTVESPDALAMRSLERFEDAGSIEFLELMTHPALNDGIDDEEAKIVVLLGQTNDYDPRLVPVLLDGTRVFKEERTINLPHSGKVLLAIIRFHDHTGPNMDYLEHAVRHHEGFMGEPLPTNYVAWYFVDYVASGQHSGTHITSNQERDPAIGEYWRAPRHAAHETGHYYWRSSQVWISEGGADMLVILSENARVGRPLVHNREQCLLFNTIGDLELADVETGSEEFYCAYTLGQRLFLDLYRTMGEEAFQHAFRRLYLKRLRDDPADACEGTYLGLCHLEAAFKAGASADVAAEVDKIIGHWYYGITVTHEGDRAELVALYHATGGANWTDSTNWLSDAHIGQWYGVATDADGRVIELNLADNGLTGELPPGLGNLANLRELLLDDNRLRGPIPPELGSLDKLTRLELDDNGLTGKIPSSLGSLINLTWLGLADNRLTGQIPSSMGGLIHLTRLELDDNNLTGEIPPSLGNLTALRYLRLVDDNRFTGCVPVGLTGVVDNDLADSGLPSC